MDARMLALHEFEGDQLVCERVYVPEPRCPPIASMDGSPSPAPVHVAA
jgi:hypothetical protein